jgi:hypothetical protein
MYHPGGAAVSRRATSAYLRSWGAQVLPGAQVACHLNPQAHGCSRRAPMRDELRVGCIECLGTAQVQRSALLGRKASLCAAPWFPNVFSLWQQ